MSLSTSNGSKGWPRNSYTGPGGGLYTGPGGGLYTGPGGGAYSGPRGGLYTGPGGGLYTGPRGGLYTGPDGGLYTGPGGGLYTGPDGGDCTRAPVAGCTRALVAGCTPDPAQHTTASYRQGTCIWSICGLKVTLLSTTFSKTPGAFRRIQKIAPVHPESVLFIRSTLDLSPGTPLASRTRKALAKSSPLISPAS